MGYMKIKMRELLRERRLLWLRLLLTLITNQIGQLGPNKN